MRQLQSTAGELRERGDRPTGTSFKRRSKFTRRRPWPFWKLALSRICCCRECDGPRLRHSSRSTRHLSPNLWPVLLTLIFRAHNAFLVSIRIGRLLQPTYYITTGCTWATGHSISNESFRDSPHKTFFLPKVPDKFAKVPDYLARRETEQKLEGLRAHSYSALPSRSDSIFLNKELDDARKWLQRGTRSNYQIYEVVAVGDHAAAEVNYIWYNYLVRLHIDPVTGNRHLFSENIAREMESCLTSYWTNEPTEKFQCPSQTEVLFNGELKIVRNLS